MRLFPKNSLILAHVQLKFSYTHEKMDWNSALRGTHDWPNGGATTASNQCIGDLRRFNG